MLRYITEGEETHIIITNVCSVSTNTPVGFKPLERGKYEKVRDTLMYAHWPIGTIIEVLSDKDYKQARKKLNPVFSLDLFE